MGRLASVNEVAGVVSFLLSDDSTYINGQNVVVDGGRTIW
jgi:NAD(P)-dependent dehydrogenase (short-subunit alcohol dehydrogenase family)